MEGFDEIIPSGDESEKKKKSSGDVEELEAERKKKMKTSLEKSRDEKEEDVEDVKMKDSSSSDDDEEQFLKRPVHDSSDEELTESQMLEYKEYRKQMVTSGGFDIDRCPPFFPCTLSPVFDLEEGDEEHRKLCRFSERAINHFNRQYGTSFKFFKYVKAVWGLCGGQKFYITFEAKEDSDDAAIIFQALVYDGIPIRDGTKVHENVQVILVRKKSSATVKDNEILLS